jgi:hypothetical protein
MFLNSSAVKLDLIYSFYLIFKIQFIYEFLRIIKDYGNNCR